jgi:Cu(I)/Ag(I) efflux system membrane fusion protein
MESGDYVEIIQGVDEGEHVVTSGQFLIDSEASMRAGIRRMHKPADGKAEESREMQP